MILFVDLDGVLADFAGRFKEFGHGTIDEFTKRHDHDDAILWSFIKKSDPEFFLNLKMMPDGKELWNYIKQFDPTILTKIPQWARASADKKKWVKKHLGNVKVITTTKKEKYVEPGAILIDDMDENLEAWKKAGGVGIKHTSASKTIKELKKIMKGETSKEAYEKYLFSYMSDLAMLLRKASGDVYKKEINIPLTENLISILKDFKNRGYSGLIVGGAVRDAILGIPSKDIDVEVYGPSYNELAEILSSYGKGNLVGKSFGVIKFMGTDGEMYDFSLPRRDSKIQGNPSQLSNTKGRGFEVTTDALLTPKDAASRRDFTINALAFDPLTSEVHDYFGGVADLENSILRAVSPAFAEDPLRVLRGMQFAARFGMEIEPETARLAATLKDQPLVIERVSDEWMKLLTKGKYPSKIMQYLIDTQWIDNYPELKSLIALQQDIRHHPEGTVDVHTGLTMDAAAVMADNAGIAGEERAVLILGAMCHDLGKATTTSIDSTTEEEPPKITSYGHHEEGARLAKQLMGRLGIKKSIEEQVIPLVQHHMDHIWFDPKSKKTNVRQLAEQLYPATIEQLEYIIRSDMSGRPPLPIDLPESAKTMLDLAQQEGVYTGPAKDLISGKDILGISSSIQEGKLIGDILKNIRNEQLRGTISTKEEALAKVNNILRDNFALIRGDDVIAQGVPKGPEIKDILNVAWKAQLAGEFSTADEAYTWLTTYFHGTGSEQQNI